MKSIITFVILYSLWNVYLVYWNGIEAIEVERLKILFDIYTIDESLSTFSGKVIEFVQVYNVFEVEQQI